MRNGKRDGATACAVAAAIACTGAFVLAAFLPEETARRWLWAVAPSIEHLAIGAGAGAVALAGLIPSVARGLVRLFEGLDRALDHRGAALGLALAWIVLAWLLRSINTALGDADMLFQHVIYDAHVYGFNTYPDEYLSRIVNSIVFRIVHEAWGVPFAQAWASLAILWGLAFIAAVRRLAGTWFPGRSAARGVALGLFLCAGSMQHFFGYIELYAGAMVLIVLYAFTAYRTAGAQSTIAIPALILGLGIAFNSFMSCLLPSLLILVLWSSRSSRWMQRGLNAVFALFLAALPLLLTWAWLQLHGYDVREHHLSKSHAIRGRFIVSVPPSDAYYLYGAFDPRHFLDLLNAIVLAAAPGAAALVTALLLGGRRLPWRGSATAVVALICAGLLGFVFVVNPDLGPARDWDLLSFGGLGLTLAGAFALPHAIPDEDRLRRVGGAFLALGLATAGPFVLSNSRTLGPDYEQIRTAPEPWLRALGTRLEARTAHEVAHLSRAERLLGLGFHALLEAAPELDITAQHPDAARLIAEHYDGCVLPETARAGLEAARQEYEEALRLHPENAMTHRRVLGLLKLMGAPAEDQLRHLEVLVRLQPNAPDRDLLDAKISTLRSDLR